MKALVYVTPKKTVLDPQGSAVAHALEQLGLKGLHSVRVGKTIEIILEGPMTKDLETQLHALSRDLLSNPVIEDYRLEILPEAD